MFVKNLITYKLLSTFFFLTPFLEFPDDVIMFIMTIQIPLGATPLFYPSGIQLKSIIIQLYKIESMTKLRLLQQLNTNQHNNSSCMII